MTNTNKLPENPLLSLLDGGGPLEIHLGNFEPRQQQREMMKDVLEAFNENAIALIEAGTGTGKSLAYLIPALLWAANFKERTVISTNTIALQEQLLKKDIPLVCKALGVEVRAVVVKGMQNYLCLRKLHDALHESSFLAPQELQELQNIDLWKESCREGSRSTLPFSPSAVTWERVCAEGDACNRNGCGHYQACRFFNARRQASEAQILIVNHHLLMADLVRRSENAHFQDPALLPSYQRLIIDEAHNIEDVATEYFAQQVSFMDILRLSARLTAEKGGKEQGKIPLLRQKIVDSYFKDPPMVASPLISRLTLDLPGMRRDLLLKAHETFELCQNFTRNLQREEDKEIKCRLQPEHFSHPYWKEKIMPRAKELESALGRYAESLHSLEKDIKGLNNSRLEEQTKNILFDIQALANRLHLLRHNLTSFLFSEPSKSRVRWMETQQLKTMVNTTLVDADLDISQKLVDHLFKPLSTVVLCSATLTTNKSFDFVNSRLGLNKEALSEIKKIEKIYDSPFDFQKQSLLVVPMGLPNPREPSFIEKAAEAIWIAIQASRGNAFVLFTSYSMLDEVFDLLSEKMKENKFHPLKQGEENRLSLLTSFINKDRSVLFGTDSFWEGIDVVGEALRCVIIVKLPFKVPGDPLLQARSEVIASHGGDPFMEYSLPQAIVKFKQGFGRLIRNKKDRGCVVVLDHRILGKNYGRLFLKSLPSCKIISPSLDDMKEEMRVFYKNTYYLTRDNTCVLGQ